MTKSNNEPTTYEQPGASDLVTFEIEGVPEPDITIEQIGDDPDIRYTYDFDECGNPTPPQFERVSHIEVKLAMLAGETEGRVSAKAQAALTAIQELETAMLDARDLTDDQRQQVALGNLEYLPEVAEILK